MLGNQLGHLKHIHGGFASEYLLQIRIGVNITLIGGILKIILLYVYPELFNNLRPGHWPLTDYSRQLGTYVQWLHKC